MHLRILSVCTALVGCCLSLSSAVADDTLFFATTYNAYDVDPPGSIVKVSFSGSVSLWNTRDAEGNAITFEDPEGIVRDGAGNVFVNDGQYVYKFDGSGVGGVFITKANPYDAFGLARDTSGNLFVQGSVYPDSSVFKYSADGSAGTPPSWNARAFDMDIGSDGLLYFADPFSQAIGRYTTDGVFDSGFEIDIPGLSTFTFAADGSIYASTTIYDEGLDEWTGRIMKVTFDEEGEYELSLYSDVGPQVFVFRGMAVDYWGNLYTATETCGCEGAENVIYVTGTNGISTVFASGEDYQRFNDIVMVPEPSTYALLGLGVAGLLFHTRKRKRSA